MQQAEDGSTFQKAQISPFLRSPEYECIIKRSLNAEGNEV
jgi:hypothetical protein